MGPEADYGVLKEIVAIAGSLIAAASAIRLAWVRRARWMPPDEAVDGGVVKVAGVICAVLIGLLFLLKDRIGLIPMAIIAVACLIVTLVTLVTSIYINTTYSYNRTIDPSESATRQLRILGGTQLTEEAASKRRQANPPSVQQLFDVSNNRPDLVWTPASMAYVQILSTVGFVGLQVSGSIALAATAIAFSIGPNQT